MPDPGHEFEALEQDVRVRKVSVMLPSDGPLSRDQVAAALDALRQYMQANDISQTDLGLAIGEAASTISGVLSGSERVPAHKRDAVLRAANVWIEEDNRRRDAERPQRFWMTKIAQRFRTVARYVRAGSQIGLVWGPAGIGKTVCAKAEAADVPGTIYLCITREFRSAARLQTRIYSASKRRARPRAAVRFEDLVDSLRGSNRLLIIDQAHRLSDSGLELLMDLHDEARLPILLVATVDLHQRISADCDPHFGQLKSRVRIKKNLFPEMSAGGKRSPGPFTVEDIRRIFEDEKIKFHPDAARMLRDKANDVHDVGHLRDVESMVFWAIHIARKLRAALITTDILLKAKRLLDGEEKLDAAQEQQQAELQEATA